MKLIIDSREQAVLDYIEHIEFQTEVKQITVGDYIIYNGSKIICCIERKTMFDYAESIKDGRIENIEKMIKLRDECGCKLFIIVEYKKKRDAFSGININNIRAHMYKQMLENNIFIIHSESPIDTMDEINQLMTRISKMDIVEGGETTDDRITKRVQKSEYDIAAKMLEHIPGVGKHYAHVLLKYSILELMTADIMEIDGRKIRQQIIDGIYKMREHDIEIWENMLAEVPQISKPMAAQLAQHIPIILTNNAANIDITQKTRVIKFGLTRANKLNDILTAKNSDI